MVYKQWIIQSLLCGPTLDVSSILPLLEQLPDEDNAGLSVHVLCATKLGHYESSIERLLDRCPQAIIPYANHELQNNNMVGTMELLPQLLWPYCGSYPMRTYTTLNPHKL